MCQDFIEAHPWKGCQVWWLSVNQPDVPSRHFHQAQLTYIHSVIQIKEPKVYQALMLEGGILQLKVRKGSCPLEAYILVCEPTNNNNYKLSQVTKQMVHSDAGREIVTSGLLLLGDQKRSLWRADRLTEMWRRRRRHHYKESVDIGKSLGCVVRQRHTRSKKNMNEKWGRCDLPHHQLHSGVNEVTSHNAAEEVLLNSHMAEGGSC